MRASLVLLLLGAAEAAQGRWKLPASPDHPGKCYDPHLQLVLAPGESKPAKGDCLRYHCVAADGEFELVFSSCGSIGVPKECVLDTPSPNSTYPQCCPQIKC